MGTAALLASVAAALYFLATGVKKPAKKGDDKKPAESEKNVGVVPEPSPQQATANDRPTVSR
jgi:hypothetical protein